MPQKLDTLVGLQPYKDSPPYLVDLSEKESTVTFSPIAEEGPIQDGDRLQVFWCRALTCIATPILVTGFYICLWRHWISHYDAQGAVPKGPAGARWAYYAWFVVSVIGIGMSRYGLAGVEASMLMERMWKPKNAMQLMAHCDKTWSGPAGWFSMRIKPSCTWIILSFISLAPYIALPLSGFTLQLRTGYSTGSSTEPLASLLGQTRDTFLDQTLDDVFTRSFNRWRSAAPPVLFGRSAYYVPAEKTTSIDRSWLQKFPNVWPDDEQVTTFIAPQSSEVTGGEAWGLEVSLNCTVVSSASQFELLSQRNEDGTAPRCPPINFNSSDSLPEYDGLPDLCDFDVYLLSPIDDSVLVALDPTLYLFPLGKMELAVQYDKENDDFSDHEAVLMEAALWQIPIEMAQYCPPLEKLVSNDLGTTVKGFRKDFALDATTAALINQSPASAKQVDAIGFQCRSSFRTGTATVDGRSGTYASFTSQEAVPLYSATPVPLPTAIPRLFRSEVSAALTLSEMFAQDALSATLDKLGIDWTEMGNGDLNPMAYIASNASWLQNIYKAADAFYRQPLYCDDHGNVNLPVTSTWQQLQLLNSSQFLTSFVRAHKAYALEMMRPTARENGELSFVGNLTIMSPALLMAPGEVPPQVVLAFLAFWAVGCFVLGLTYGFRPRWSESLDGFSMFLFGSDNPHLNEGDGSRGGGCSARHYPDCSQLTQLPGLVGHARPEREVGYISLVEGWRGVAGRRKQYH